MPTTPSKIEDILARLVAAPTQNPGGDELALGRLLHAALAVHAPDQLDLHEVPRPDGIGMGAVVIARWGRPSLLINAHLDTVPTVAEGEGGWSSSPWQLREENGVFYGLGAADTKGAIAAILSALEKLTASGIRPRDVLIVFSGDEERTSSCMRWMVDSPTLLGGITHAVVCEPTGCKLGTRHRGILALEVDRVGTGAHSSRADELPAPVGELSCVGAAIYDWGRARRKAGPEGFAGMCTNIAGIDGGGVFNIVPARATLRASVRPPPGVELGRVREELAALIQQAAPLATTRIMISNPPFSTADLPSFRPLFGSLVDHPIDLGFWTEAALLAERGIDAVVYGPGDIGVAHAANEHVSRADLVAARDAFASMLQPPPTSTLPQKDPHGSR